MQSHDVEIGEIRIVTLGELREAHFDKTDVLDSRLLGQVFGFLDMGGIEVDAYKVAIRICSSEQQRAIPPAAPQLAITHPRLEWRSIPVDQRDKGQMLWSHFPIKA